LPDEDEAAAPGRSCRASSGALDRSGRVNGVALGDLLRSLYETRESGVLTLIHRRERSALLLSHGTVAAASSSDQNHRIGRIAVRLGIIPERMVETVIGESCNAALG